MTENKINEVDILNFALNLEYLEAGFTRTPPLVSRSRVLELGLKAARMERIRRVEPLQSEARR